MGQLYIHACTHTHTHTHTHIVMYIHICMCRKVDEFQNYSDMDSMLQYCKDVQTVQRRLSEIQEQVNQINKASYPHVSFSILHAKQLLVSKLMTTIILSEY